MFIFPAFKSTLSGFTSSWAADQPIADKKKWTLFLPSGTGSPVLDLLFAIHLDGFCFSEPLVWPIKRHQTISNKHQKSSNIYGLLIADVLISIKFLTKNAVLQHTGMTRIQLPGSRHGHISIVRGAAHQFRGSDLGFQVSARRWSGC